MKIIRFLLVVALIVNGAAVIAQEEEEVQALNMLPKASTSLVSSDALGFSLGAGEPRRARAGFEDPFFFDDPILGFDDPIIALDKQGAKISSYSSQSNGFNFCVVSVNGRIMGIDARAAAPSRDIKMSINMVIRKFGSPTKQGRDILLYDDGARYLVIKFSSRDMRFNLRSKKSR